LKRKAIDIFTDGSSFIKGDYYESSSAFLIFENRERAMSGGEYHPGGTISYGEIYAVRLGLDSFIKEMYNEEERYWVRVFIDSEYVVNSLNKWIYNWIKQGIDRSWKTASGKEVMYQDVFKYIYKNYIVGGKSNVEVDFFHINGHIGEKKDIKKAYRHFVKKNKMVLNEKYFEYLINGNRLVDRIAERMRLKDREGLFDIPYPMEVF
jgi:ribonuclease HI